MVIDDREFGALCQKVDDMSRQMDGLVPKVDRLLEVYNQGIGVSKCLSPFREKLCNLIWYLIPLGALVAISRLFPHLHLLH